MTRKDHGVIWSLGCLLLSLLALTAETMWFACRIARSTAMFDKDSPVLLWAVLRPRREPQSPVVVQCSKRSCGRFGEESPICDGHIRVGAVQETCQHKVGARREEETVRPQPLIQGHVFYTLRATKGRQPRHYVPIGTEEFWYRFSTFGCSARSIYNPRNRRPLPKRGDVWCVTRIKSNRPQVGFRWSKAKSRSCLA